MWLTKYMELQITIEQLRQTSQWKTICSVLMEKNSRLKFVPTMHLGHHPFRSRCKHKSLTYSPQESNTWCIGGKTSQSLWQVCKDIQGVPLILCSVGHLCQSNKHESKTSLDVPHWTLAYLRYSDCTPICLPILPCSMCCKLAYFLWWCVSLLRLCHV
jgi:hypothetical protein